ncbi:hypothetical protein FHR37_001444 [Actinopolymorpha cephalotaxi]|uniref:Uncharacterized protein n=1 Tax=Actinopolymorpha cephalotaxi TaxID=504797 RepID=A0ABX2RZ22_9ACTN|nr:hypothetical protein [Actinopolymorpha cephalotaxi]
MDQALDGPGERFTMGYTTLVTTAVHAGSGA